MSVAAARTGLVAGTVLLLLAGCAGSRNAQDSDSTSPPFVFRSLDLHHKDGLGRPAWSLTSPEARYDLRRRVAQADRIQGVIHRDGRPAYHISAISGTVLNEGEVVLLEGKIRLEQLGKRPLLIRAERARWFPQRNQLELDRSPEALAASTLIRSRHASYNFGSRLLSLREQPQLEQWSQPLPLSGNSDRGRPELVVHVASADWNTGNGDLSTKGPLLAERRVPGRSATSAVQTLRASRLEGNTSTQLFWLRGPVRWQDPAERSSLSSGDVRVDAASHWLTSSSGCRLQRGTDVLQARSCGFNWLSQGLLARGEVQLSRSQPYQLTRGGLLRGRLGPDGIVVLTNPGGRVISRLQVPHRSGRRQPPRVQRPRPSPEPIRL